MEFRDLKYQYSVLQSQIDEAVVKVMTNADFISGKEVTEFEQAAAKFVGVKHCISCANGTDAITLSLKAYGVGEGDAVFVPDFTFFSSAECPASLGATPIFTDIDLATYNMDADSLIKQIEYVLSEGKLNPKAVVAVDLFGLCADYERLRAVCDKYGLLLLEDGAQGFGGRINDKTACSFGDIATSSFFPAKPLGCYGDGGAVFTDDDEKAELIRSLCVHGKGKLGKYDNIRLGYNSRLDTIQAAILNVKLKAFVEYELSEVNLAAQTYTALLKDKVITPNIPDGYYSSWAQYTVRLENEEQRNYVSAELKKSGIPTMVYYPKLMHEQGAFANLDNCGDFTCALKAKNTVLQLPIHPYIKPQEIQFVAKKLTELL